MVAKRGLSAYFIFASEKRTTTKQELLAAATDGKPPSVAEVAKSIGHKWRELGEAGQQPYKEKAATLAAAAVVEPAAHGSSQGEINLEAADQDECESQGLPLTSVKRIMCVDEDVARVSGDCVKAVSTATEMFLRVLATRASLKAKLQKRSTIKFCDIHQAAIADKRMVEMGLKGMFAHEAMFADTRSEANESGTTAKRTGKMNVPCVPARPITDFFKA